MLSFKELQEKKTKVILNPKLDQLKEKDCGCDDTKKKKKCPKCDGKGCKHCGGTGYHSADENESMEEQAYVSQEEVSEESTEEVAETETSLLTFGQFNEDRAADAKASLEKVKARQKVLDAHEKKTGNKLDINKSVEAREHKKNFPGAKRTGKKVKGAKETSLEKHNRRVQTYTDRLKKYGKTTKQKRDDDAMSKQTSRFD